MEIGERISLSANFYVLCPKSTVQSREAVMGDREAVKSRQSCVGSLRREKSESEVHGREAEMSDEL